MQQLTHGDPGKAQIVEDDELFSSDKPNQDGEEKWYLINEDKTLPQIWNMIMNCLTIYTLFATPFMYLNL